MKLKQILAGMVLLGSFAGFTACSDDDYSPVTLVYANNSDSLLINENNTLLLNPFSEGETFRIQGGNGVYTIDNANKDIVRCDYDGKTLTPGMIKELNAGDEVQVVNPTGQATDATSYTKLQQRLIGSGQGLSYEATSRDMSETNYASARQGMIEDEMTYQEEEEAILEIMDEIYETFVISCVLAGNISLNNFWNKKDDYMNHGWVKQPKKWIDPLKESSATKTALNTGQKTYKQIAAEAGKDWRQQIDDTAEVIEYARQKGVDMEGVIFGGKTNV